MKCCSFQIWIEDFDSVLLVSKLKQYEEMNGDISSVIVVLIIMIYTIGVKSEK